MVHDNYAYLPDAEVSEAWYSSLLTAHAYKNGKIADDETLKNMIVDSLKVYEQHAKSLPALSEEEKQEKRVITMKYTDGLVEKGGISTDVFKKELGTEKTKHFFDTVFFGTLAQ